MSSLNSQTDRAHNLATPAWVDLYRGAKAVPLWGRLGWLEVKRRYRRTVLGPIWSTLSLAIFVLAIGAMGAGLWNQETGSYLTFLSSGMVVWIMLSTMITEGCGLFINETQNIRQLRFDYSLLAFSCVWRNLIVFAHNVWVYIILAVIFSRLPMTPAVLLVIPGILLMVLNGLWISICFGLLCSRFRDIQQLVTSLVQIAMFITPIFWPPDNLQGIRRLIFVDLHPLYHVIEVVRAPLLGKVPLMESYVATVLIIIVGWITTYFLYNRFSRRIAYWL
jgi:ABC-type polysaccharide/polyol phosphate export permease